MRKRYLYAALLAGVLGMTACSSEDIVAPGENVEQTAETMTISVSMPEKSRISYEEGVESDVLKWQEGDVLTVFAGDYKVSGKLYEYNLVSGADTKTATFEGPMLGSVKEVKLYYKSKNLTVGAAGELEQVNYNEQMQMADASTAHLKDYLHIESEVLTAGQFGSGNISMQMKSAMMRLDLHSLPAEMGKIESISWTNNKGTANEKAMTIALNPAEKYNKVFISFDPQEMKLEAGKDICMSFTTDKGQWNVSATSTAGKVYEAGTKYEIGISNDGNTDYLHTWAKVELPFNHAEYKDYLVVRMLPGAEPVGKNNRLENLGMTRIGDTDYWKSNDKKAWVSRSIEDTKDILEVYVPEGITEVGIADFQYAEGLEKVVLPSSIVSIADYAFVSCVNLKEINLPEGLETLSSDAFESCSSLESIAFPSTLTRLKMQAFWNCTKLSKVTFASGCKVTNIPRSCFKNTNITEIDIPASVTSIDYAAFGECKALTRINFTSDSKMYQIAGGAFVNSGITSFEFPALVTNTDSEIFLDCAQLTSITIPANFSKGGFVIGELNGIANLKTLKCLKKGFIINFSDFTPSTIDLVLAKGMESEVTDGLTWNKILWKSITFE